MPGSQRFTAGLVSLLLMSGAPAVARDSLGVYGTWGAFRDAQPHRCYAIALPNTGGRGNGRWRPFASISSWPDQNVRGQLHIRLSTSNGTPVELRVDEARFSLVRGGADAWAPNAAADAAIIAAMRSGHVLRIGSAAYSLKGAASAIDAAALGCTRSR